MCGIAGFWGSRTLAGIDSFRATLLRMGETVAHRGPDDSDCWADMDSGLGLVHRRLAIMDLSSAGHQPMQSTCGRYVLVYNGEIYNHHELRSQLESEQGHVKWRGHSDTETLLEALCHWGVEKTLIQLNGMFAFALWDGANRNLFLARDRMGEKPLYYGHCGETFLFGSELKALKVHPAWSGEIDRNALALFLRYNYIPAPLSIFSGMYKLKPAHYLVVRDNGKSVSEPICYWDLCQIMDEAVTNPINNPGQLVTELDSLLRDAVAMRMESDVPLGAFLSGGYDSTTIVALMQEQSHQPVKTFSIGFHESKFNEAECAKAIAKHLNTEHTEIYVTPEQALAVIPTLPEIYDEPFSDSSQIPTILVSQLARQHVTVSLSGDGGDELFCGYNRYVLGYRIWKKLQIMPLALRRSIAWFLNHAPADTLDKLQGILPQKIRVSSLGDRLPKLAEVLSHADEKAFYRALVSHWKDPEQIVIGAKESDPSQSLYKCGHHFSDFREQMMFMDMQTYLPDDILTKVDRASMSVSLEARVPLLDHRLVEFAWRVPMQFKYRHGSGKWLLRQVLYKYVPRRLVDRPKMGFGLPIEQWLRGPLREWANQLLNEKKLREQGYLHAASIRQKWDEHVSGKRRWHYYLWDVLMFQAWLENQA